MSVTNKEIIFDEEVLDELLKGCKTQEDFFGEGGIVKKFVKAVTERALKGELTTHLGYERHHNVADTEGSNSRNGYSKKRIKGEFGETEIEVPRDREGTFDPKFVGKNQTRFRGCFQTRDAHFHQASRPRLWQCRRHGA